MNFTNAVIERHPQTIMGIMKVEGLDTATDVAAWNELKARELDAFRTAHHAYDRKKALTEPPISGYAEYYKQFKKTYPVLLQRESVLLKGGTIKSPCLAVETMFMAEVKHGLLVAGHDAQYFSGDCCVGLAVGGESFTVVSGKERTMKAGDLYLQDGGAVLSSVLEGQDYTSRLTAHSAAAVYCAYGLYGVTAGQMAVLFDDLTRYLASACPQAVAGTPQITQAAA